MLPAPALPAPARQHRPPADARRALEQDLPPPTVPAARPAPPPPGRRSCARRRGTAGGGAGDLAAEAAERWAVRVLKGLRERISGLLATDR
ncbi:predicted protein [Streptomyces pristinaespiralis ATCC 25486]|uniref:Predicted protein n=1 Tax=Streptomyces pristinaespiralis (strain ATCC 25486 / DSM 40338 / CBS 914.69 / JCM 4507 / KCC S-0507 / NBRC 13074 / NRRL 2958 / 5647) TaxID=457429 RepID=D6X6M1_STRE2|nr:predicted protein [Streptomyces pristinaespiralis ATCC 25486]